jgi:membrane protein YqaA with SNARE-associated domain
MARILSIFLVFLTCSFAFKVGFPATIMLFDYNFPKTILVACAGGIAGNIIFTYLSAAILKAIHNFRARRNLIHRRRIFTSLNRRIIRVRQKFGLAGIAFITPILLSTPLGAFIAERFYRDKKKIILYLSLATIFWALALYSIFILVHGSLSEWFS